jgi:hypothetical protein
MKNIFLTLAFSVTTVLTFAQTKPFELEKKWELSGFNNPESIVLDETKNLLYVSNVNGAPTDKDNNGYISKVSTDGKIITQKWIEGLHAPKGMVISKGKLFVTDINDIVSIDIVTGKILNRFFVEGSTFLNDITADKKGNIYASNTFGFSAIYQLNTNGKVSTFIKDETLQMPNGLLVDGKNLLVAPWGIDFDPNTWQTKTGGSILKVDLKTKAVSSITKPIGNLDGLEKTVHGYIATDWLAGKLFYIKDNTATEVLDLPQGSADLEFDISSKTIFIPLMNDNKIVVYEFKK